MATLLIATNELSREERFEALYQQFYQRIYKYLVKQTRNQEQAEDLAQDTFLRLYWKCDLLKNNEKQISAWLYRTALNLFRDTYRHACLINWLPLDGTNEDALSLAEQLAEECDLEEETIKHEALARLDRLPLHERQMTYLARWGYEPAEIAAILNTTPQIIKMRWYRVMCLLRTEAQAIERPRHEKRYTTQLFRPGRVGVWDEKMGDFVKNRRSGRKTLFYRNENAEKLAEKLNAEELKEGAIS